MDEDWEISILKCYKDIEGKAYNRDIYDKIGDYVKLKEEHHKITYKRPNYEHQVRKHISNLVKMGDLKKFEDGLNEITDKGLERLSKLDAIEEI